MPKHSLEPLYDAARMPMFHGHKVLAALFLAGFMVYGGRLYCFVLLVPPLTQEFHWSRAATGGLVTAFWLSAPLILLGGSAIRRFGATRLLIAGIVLEARVRGVPCPKCPSFGEMYALRAAMGVGKVMFAVTLPYTVSRWFSRHYSFGLGLVWAGWHVGGMVLVPITGLIHRSVWMAVPRAWRLPAAWSRMLSGRFSHGTGPFAARFWPGSRTAIRSMRMRRRGNGHAARRGIHPRRFPQRSAAIVDLLDDRAHHPVFFMRPTAACSPISPRLSSLVLGSTSGIRRAGRSRGRLVARPLRRARGGTRDARVVVGRSIVAALGGAGSFGRRGC